MKQVNEREIIFLKKTCTTPYLVVFILTLIPLFFMKENDYYVLILSINMISLFLLTLYLRLKIIRRITFLPSGLIINKGILLSDFIDYKHIIGIEEVKGDDTHETVYLYTKDKIYDIGKLSNKGKVVSEVNMHLKNKK